MRVFTVRRETHLTETDGSAHGDRVRAGVPG
jgi:hypothetical protein